RSCRTVGALGSGSRSAAATCHDCHRAGLTTDRAGRRFRLSAAVLWHAPVLRPPRPAVRLPLRVRGELRAAPALLPGCRWPSLRSVLPARPVLERLDRQDALTSAASRHGHRPNAAPATCTTRPQNSSLVIASSSAWSSLRTTLR